MNNFRKLWYKKSGYLVISSLSCATDHATMVTWYTVTFTLQMLNAQAIKSKFIHESDQGCIQYGGKFWLNPIKRSLSDSLPLSLSETTKLIFVWFTSTRETNVVIDDFDKIFETSQSIKLWPKFCCWCFNSPKVTSK